MSTIRFYQDSDKPQWDSYVLNHPQGTFFHLIGWKNVIEKTFHHKSYYLLAVSDQDSTFKTQHSEFNTQSSSLSPQSSALDIQHSTLKTQNSFCPQSSALDTQRSTLSPQHSSKQVDSLTHSPINPSNLSREMRSLFHRDQTDQARERR
jgi:hypothetical protein